VGGGGPGGRAPQTLRVAGGTGEGGLMSENNIMGLACVGMGAAGLFVLVLFDWLTDRHRRQLAHEQRMRELERAREPKDGAT
jgi:hypothetical protein